VRRTGDDRRPRRALPHAATPFSRAAAAIAGDPELAKTPFRRPSRRPCESGEAIAVEGSLEAWVWRIVINAARDAGRRQRPLLVLHDAAEPASPNGRAASLPLELLTDRQREVLFLHLGLAGRASSRPTGQPARL
jgi:hypothetical protein